MRKSLFSVTLIAIFILCICCIPIKPAHAVNIEFLDEINLGAELASPDCILKTKHIAIGAKIGFSDGLEIKDSLYAIGTVTITGFTLFDLTK